MSHETMIKDALDRSMSYPEYREKVDELFAQGKTTGSNQNEALLYYTQLNIQRMQKWEKRYMPDPAALEAMATIKDELWLVLTEAWCGDAAHSLPVINKLVSANTTLDLRVVLRDENLELMDRYLTNGGRSIPKLIRMRAGSLEVINTWGPRPEPAQAIFQEMKAAGNSKEEYTKALQLWYARDRGKTTEAEIAQFVMNVKV